jgi:hypothetical protein
MDEEDLEGLGIDTIKIDDVLGDPDLLAELHSLGWNEHHPTMPLGAPAKPDRTPAVPATKLPVPTAAHVEIPPELDESDFQLEEADLNDPELMKMYEQLASGNAISSIEYSTTIETTLSSISTPAAATNISIPQVVPTSPNSTKRSDSSVLDLSNTSISAEDATRRALEAKRAGKTDEALYWFRISKQQQQKQQPSTSMQPLNQTPVRANVSSVSSPVNPAVDPNFITLEAALSEASRSALALAKSLRESEPQQAVVQMREYKRFEQELATLRIRRNIPGARAPSFRWTVKHKKISLERLEIAENELRVIIDGVFEIDTLLREHKVKDLSLEISIGSAGKESELGCQRTAAVKYDAGSKSAQWKFQTSFDVVKRSKVTQATQLRKRVTLKLIGQKTGMLWSSTVDLAMAILPFSDLATVSESGGRTALFQITQGEDGATRKGKAIGGYLVANLQVRKPLSGEESRTIEERQLQLEPWPALPVPVSNTAASPSTAESNAASAATSTSTPSAGADYGAGLTDREKSDPEAVDFLESNDVLEAEIARVQQQLQSGQLDEDAQFNATLRMQLLQVKLQTLVLRVQNETLSLEDYLEILRERVRRDKQLALYLSKVVGDAEARETAVRVMRRMKIMEQEIDNAAAANEEEEEGTT